MYGKISAIEEVTDLVTRPVGIDENYIGFAQAMSVLCGYTKMDGYKVTTDKTEIMVMITNGQQCCEDWGYFSSDDNLDGYIAADLLKIELTDTALNKKVVENSGYHEGGGGIQFVDFVTSKGAFQLAVYNAHNGYYGHGIVVTINGDVIHEDSL